MINSLAQTYLKIMDDHDVGRASQLFSDDFVCHIGASTDSSATIDRAGWMAMVTAWFTAFPDLTPTSTRVITDPFNGDFAVHMAWQATHLGEFAGFSATGRQVKNSGVSVFRVVDGVVAEEWIYEDMTNLLTQVAT